MIKLPVGELRVDKFPHISLLDQQCVIHETLISLGLTYDGSFYDPHSGVGTLPQVVFSNVRDASKGEKTDILPQEWADSHQLGDYPY
jgi:hypothetical protein